ncbi:hypothetical protein [Aliiroseovarius sp. YM-037]|uniref:hypothetical protein n=1 Tax=Aliiroseovarius sp. YM-037 TaxID=3341728 RepID=UPI003A801D52
MTGLLSRLAARGAGRSIAGGPARLAPPARPRFAMPEAGEGLEFDETVERPPADRTDWATAQREPPREKQPSVTGSGTRTDGRQRPRGIDAVSQSKKAAPTDLPSTLPMADGGVARPEAHESSEPTAPPQVDDTNQPTIAAQPDAHDPTSPSTRNQQPDLVPQRGLLPPIANEQIASAPADLSALETVEHMIETEITPSPTDGFAPETSSPPALPGTPSNAFPDHTLPDPPAPSLSIGRIDVIFESPDPPPAPRQRPSPERTRGFEGYSSIRLGRRR